MTDRFADLIGDPDYVGEGPSCGRCMDEGPLFPANCEEKPETLLGHPLGMYHCPDCGAMVVAGFPHPDLCQRCIDRTHPSYDPMEPWPIVKGETYVHVKSCGFYTVTNCGSDNRVKMQGEWVNGVTYRRADLSDETHYTRTEADFRAGFLPANRRGT